MMHNSIIKMGLLVAVCCLKSAAQTPPDMLGVIFPQGDKIEGGNFTGTVWVKPLLPADAVLNASIGNVVFEPKARSNWHKHPGGQTLLALDGIGYYQEKGKSLQILRQGDVVRCPPDVEHWHGASHDSWFVQLAITSEHPKGRVIWLHEVSEEEYRIGIAKQQEAQSSLQNLEKRHKHIVTISAFTAKGNLERLKNAINDGLNAGLTVNEIKEVLVHLYAYCGFPRSIQGLNTLLSVLEARKTQGITDEMGKSATPIPDSLSKYERGLQVLEALTGQPQITPPKSGYGAFSPEIDIFLKEHLFADIFGRDVLSYQDREIATITALVNLGGVEPMLKGHIGIALNIGITESQLKNIIDWSRKVTAEEHYGKNPPAVNNRNVEQEIISLSKEKWRWMSERNVDTLVALFHEKAVFVHMGGNMTKEQELGIIKSGGIHYKHAEIQETSVQFIGNTAVLLSKIRLDAVVGGNEVTNPFTVTEVYVQQDGKWTLASLSFTKLLNP